MEDRLRPINAVLGLVTPGDINSPALLDAGFRLVGLEVPIVGPQGRVVVDIVLFHDATLHLLLVEAKSGANIEISQAERYAGLDATAVVQATGVSIPQRGTVTFEVVYACRSVHLARILIGLAGAKLECPVIAIGRRSVALENEGTASPELAAAWAAGPVQLSGPPVRLMPFDHETPASDLQEYVRAQLVAELSNRRTEITVRLLAEQTARYFPLFSNAARRRLVTNVREAVRTIVTEDADTFAYVPSTATRADDLVRMIKTPEDRDPRGRTQSYQSLRDWGRRRRGAPVSEHQIDLLDLLADVSPEEDDIPLDNDEPREEQR